MSLCYSPRCTRHRLITIPLATALARRDINKIKDPLPPQNCNRGMYVAVVCGLRVPKLLFLHDHLVNCCWCARTLVTEITTVSRHQTQQITPRCEASASDGHRQAYAPPSKPLSSFLSRARTSQHSLTDCSPPKNSCLLSGRQNVSYHWGLRCDRHTKR